MQIRTGKPRNAKRNLSLTPRAAELLTARKANAKSDWVFPGETDAAPILGTSLDHQHDDVRTALKLPKDFVIHSLRHTMLTRLGEAGADAFTIMRIAGHSSVTVSQPYVHPTPEGLERALERLQNLNAENFGQAQAEAQADGTNGMVPTISRTVQTKRSGKSSQVVEFKKTGP
jgi:integrase